MGTILSVRMCGVLRYEPSLNVYVYVGDGFIYTKLIGSFSKYLVMMLDLNKLHFCIVF